MSVRYTTFIFLLIYVILYLPLLLCRTFHVSKVSCTSYPFSFLTFLKQICIVHINTFYFKLYNVSYMIYLCHKRLKLIIIISDVCTGAARHQSLLATRGERRGEPVSMRRDQWWYGAKHIVRQANAVPWTAVLWFSHKQSLRCISVHMNIVFILVCSIVNEINVTNMLYLLWSKFFISIICSPVLFRYSVGYFGTLCHIIKVLCLLGQLYQLEF